MDAVLKQRLIGAAVIWVLALVFLPMMLEKPRQSSQAASSQLSLPNMPEERREVRSLDLVQKPSPPAAQKPQATAQEAHKPSIASNQAGNPAQAQEALQKQVANSQPAQASQPVTAQADKSKVKATSTTAKSAPVSTGKWVIQVGSFSDRANAESLAKRVRARDYPVVISKFELGNRSLYRVQVGPVRNRADANEKLAKLQGQLGLNGKVVALP